MALSVPQRRGIAAALGAAALFAATVPLAKPYLGAVNPWLLASLLYLGCGIGLTLVSLARPRPWTMPRSDLPWLAGAVVTGGVLAPVLLMMGLAAAPASGVSLLLVAEGVFTTLIAWIAFRENLDRRVLLGFLVITVGAVVLVARDSATRVPVVPAAFILGACLAWAIDNNLTRKVSLADAVHLAAIKGLAAGATNYLLAASMGAVAVPFGKLASVGLIGFLGYGVSLVLFVVALRELGAARTSAYFSTAPFLGAAFAVVYLAEPLTLTLLLAGVLMALGVWLHLTESHVHDHGHDAVSHEHFHDHDEHHRHHPEVAGATAPHSHPHEHLRIRHRHAHFPDAHHRHDH